MADWASLSVFDRIMVAGGSASIINALIAIILIIILLKAKTLKPMMRLFLIQLMGTQFVQGIGYFLIGGIFSVGDWGNVYEHINDVPNLVTVLRIVLSILGCGGIVALFFILNYLSYSFIENTENNRSARKMSFRVLSMVQ